jgi:hypothetical protein
MVLIGFIAVFLMFAAGAWAADEIYYARCNLKVLDGNQITWVNWQAATNFIPVNTKLKVTRNGSKATLVNAESGSSYTLDIGADGEPFLEKFVVKTPVNMKGFSAEVQAAIKDTIARVGMTKEQVYIAMGPPSNLGRDQTINKTYKEIMSSDLWVYLRRRFSKNIGVGFDSAGKVNRTEGIWR